MGVSLAGHAQFQAVGAQGRLGGQLDFAVHGAEVVGGERLGRDDVVAAVAQGGGDGGAGLQGGVCAVQVVPKDAGVVHGVAGPVDGPVGVEVDPVAVGREAVPTLPPPVPVAPIAAPGAIQAGHGGLIARLADGHERLAGGMQLHHAVGIGRSLANARALVVVQRDVHAGGGRLRLELAGPHYNLVLAAAFDGQDVPAEDDEHLVLAGVGVAGAEHIDARRHTGRDNSGAQFGVGAAVGLAPGGDLRQPAGVDGFAVIGFQAGIAAGEIGRPQGVQREVDCDAGEAGPELDGVAAGGVHQLHRRAVPEVDGVVGRTGGERPGVVFVQHDLARGVLEAGVEGDAVSGGGDEDVGRLVFDGFTPFRRGPHEAAGRHRLQAEVGFDAGAVHGPAELDADSAAGPDVAGVRARRDG